MKEFGKFLEKNNLELKRYDPKKPRAAISTNDGEMTIHAFHKKVKALVTPIYSKYPKVMLACLDSNKFGSMVEDYSKSIGRFGRLEKFKNMKVPSEYRRLTLNLDQTSTTQDLKFFCTTSEEQLAPISGRVYLRAMGIDEDTAVEMSRKVVPQYMPREAAGVSRKRDPVSGLPVDIYNTYSTPSWRGVKLHRKAKLPVLAKKLIWHLFPLPEEREYFFAWLYKSLFERSYVYLILCGAPGTGKNRLQLLLRALHGHANFTAGKKSSLTDRFNGQFAESTLVWFDELKYSVDQENVMKELQNDSISIERKGIDASKSTRLFASFAISNNKPRDNYIDFDARKFAPLLLNNKRLETSMTSDQIERLSRKVEKEDDPEFSPLFLKQIVSYVKRVARPDKFPNLEYKGPMFWRLCHTSMSRWQKMAAATILESPEDGTGRVQFEKGRGFRWSVVEDALQKKGKIKDQMTDYSTVMHFFNVFRDGSGQGVFETTPVPRSAMGDFWVRVINKEARILNEAEVLASMGKVNVEKGSKEKTEKSGKEKSEQDVRRSSDDSASGAGDTPRRKKKKKKKSSSDSSGDSSREERRRKKRRKLRNTEA